MFEKVWAIVFAMSGMSEISTLFTFKCRIGLEEGFPVILRTIVQTFLIEVRLLILDTKNSGECSCDTVRTPVSVAVTQVELR